MAEEGWREVHFRHSPSLIDVLRQMGCSLLVSTYQAGKLIAVGLDGDELQISFHEFDQAMGVAASREQVAVGARGQAWFLKDQSKLAGAIEPRGRYDRCYLAREARVTGEIQCHELAWGADGELWVVNTLFSCLANVHADYHFVPRWRPPFVTGLAAEDRCHLNGLAMRDGRPAAVTVMGRTNTDRGWRQDKLGGGCVLDVPSGEPISTGLTMPHSPRWHGGRLYVLNSGHGTLEMVDPGNGARAVVASVPGFSRGLACHGNLAFVGLSKIRETAVFGGMPIAEQHEELKCGVGVIDLTTGTTVATLEFASDIEEIFDVQVLPDARCVALTGGRSGAQGEIWVVPPEAQSATALNDRGNQLQDAGDQASALDAYRQAIATDPAFGPARQNLGYLLINRGHTAEGIEQLEAAQAIAPADVNRVMIATALPVVYESEEHRRASRARLESEVGKLDGVRIDTTDSLVPTTFFTAYQGEDDRDLNAAVGRIYRGVDASTPPPPRDRPRIGFLSAYFREHTIGRLNVGRIEHLDRERFEVVVLSATDAEDPLAERFRAAADRFVAIPRKVAEARRLIAEQELDLLFFTDVGMDALTYTLAFSRMAPVQATTWGHPVTTGSPTMDHFVSSALLETRDGDAHYTERLARLPSLATYYERPPRPDGIGEARRRFGLVGAHVYACPQTLFKFHPGIDRVLTGILDADPDGVLVMIKGRSPAWTELLKTRFARTLGKAAERVRWLPAMPREDYLRLLACADVVLDPTHFGGGNSTYEALAMDTPVVTLPSPLMRSRIAAALYAKTGYQDLVVATEEEYVETCVSLGTDMGLRAAASRRIADSAGVLFEDVAEVRDLEAFFTQALT